MGAAGPAVQHLGGTGCAFTDARTGLCLRAEHLADQPGLRTDPQHLTPSLYFCFQLIGESLLRWNIPQEYDDASARVLLHQLPGSLGRIDTVELHAVVFEHTGHCGVPVEVGVLRPEDLSLGRLQQLGHQGNRRRYHCQHYPELPAGGRRADSGRCWSNGG